MNGRMDQMCRVKRRPWAELISDTTEFKTNCTLVIVDFFVRHGVIGPEEPGYMELVASLRTGGGD